MGPRVIFTISLPTIKHNGAERKKRIAPVFPKTSFSIVMVGQSSQEVTVAKKRPSKRPIDSSGAPTHEPVPCPLTPGNVSRRTALGLGLGIIGFGAYALGNAPDARAVDENGFPTWEEVEAARANEAAKGGEISRIQGLIADMQQRVAETQAAANRAGDEYYVAQQAFQNQQRTAKDLEQAAAAQSAAADSASERAAQAANQLVRQGGDSKALELFFNGSPNPTDALTDLGRVERIVQQNQSLYDGAVAARNTATQLSQQAQAAAAERDRLQKIAQDTWTRAQDAATAARNALFEQQLNLDRLNAQLAALQDTTAKTVAEYQAGVEYREQLERERLAREAAERAEAERRAAEAAAEAERIRQEQEEEERRRREEWEANNPTVPAPPPDPTPAPSPSGWAHPLPGGWVTSVYGARPSFWTPGGWTNSWHDGTDFYTSGGCGSRMVAMHSGTIEFAGWSGGFGYHVVVNHHNGYASSYSHIQEGGIAVWAGQWVEAGQTVAYMGTTGRSTGCHLHFEVYVGGPNGGTTDPESFLWNVGIRP